MIKILLNSQLREHMFVGDRSASAMTVQTLKGTIAQNMTTVADFDQSHCKLYIGEQAIMSERQQLLLRISHKLARTRPIHRFWVY